MQQHINVPLQDFARKKELLGKAEKREDARVYNINIPHIGAARCFFHHLKMPMGSNKNILL